MLDTLERSVAAQRQLVADASHELRTPITSLRTNIEVLAEAESLPPDERARLLAGRRGADDRARDARRRPDRARARRRAAARERGRAPRPPRRRGADPRAPPRAGRRTSRPTCSPAVVEGTRERLARAVNNLLDNAAKHSPRRRRRRGASPTSHGVRVRDHGTGVDPEDLPHLFDRFYRGASSRGRPGLRPRAGDRAPGRRAARRQRPRRQRAGRRRGVRARAAGDGRRRGASVRSLERLGDLAAAHAGDGAAQALSRAAGGGTVARTRATHSSSGSSPEIRPCSAVVTGASTWARRSAVASSGTMSSASTAWPIRAGISRRGDALAEQLAGAAVARLRRERGADEVARAGEPDHRLRLAALALGVAPDLGEDVPGGGARGVQALARGRARGQRGGVLGDAARARRRRGRWTARRRRRRA